MAKFTDDDGEIEPPLTIFTVQVPRGRTELVEAVSPESAALFAADVGLGTVVSLFAYDYVTVTHPDGRTHFPLKDLDAPGFSRGRNDTRYCRFIRICGVCKVNRLTMEEAACPVCTVRYTVEHREPRDCRAREKYLSERFAWEVFVHEPTPEKYAVRWSWTDGRGTEQGMLGDKTTLYAAVAFLKYKVQEFQTYQKEMGEE